MNVGERIKNRRKQLGMSAEQLAEKIGKAPATVYRYENGFISKVDSEKLMPIAEALLTTPAYLMGWEDEDTALSDLQKAKPASKHRVQNIKAGTVARGKTKLDLTTDDDRLWQRREALRRDPKRKVLFDLAENGTDRDVDAAVKLLDALRATNPDFYDGDDPA